MPVYRFYFTKADGHLVGVPGQIECVDDAEAMIRARERLAFIPSGGVAIEVWELRRLVGRIPAQHERPHPSPNDEIRSDD
jgi:hypothetical protein